MDSRRLSTSCLRSKTATCNSDTANLERSMGYADEFFSDGDKQNTLVSICSFGQHYAEYADVGSAERRSNCVYIATCLSSTYITRLSRNVDRLSTELICHVDCRKIGSCIIYARPLMSTFSDTRQIPDSSSNTSNTAPISTRGDCF